jgi:hypothetical protein
MKLFNLVLISLVIVGCGKKTNTITQYVQSPPVVENDVLKVVDIENEYRLASGQLPLTQGLTCSLYSNLSTSLIAFPTVLPTAAATYTYVGAFNHATPTSSGLTVIPSSIRSLYNQWYAIRCTGQLVITKSGYYNFSVASDDASILYIDGVKLVDNDGNHSNTVKSAMKLLKTGVHAFRIDYMQATGVQTLVISDDSGVIPSNKFYR